ncbi:MAG: diadenylate cyclase CdaA [Oscillospiraceae bacterium]|nr:diadenylate cyclase CdaA [Oscillospiraceae bacterium]
MDLLYEIKYSLMTIFPPSIFDILDIALLAYIIYQIIKFMLENRAGGLFKGLAVLVGAYLVAKIAHMKALTFIFENAFNVGLIALVILFQPELRRSLEKMGRSSLAKLRFGEDSEAYEKWEVPINEICEACRELSASSTGALIVIERTEKLGEQVRNGITLNSDITCQLLGNLFFKNAPLHDGAAIIRDGRLLSAGCTLPSAAKPELVNKSLGTRHKAAIGMSENSDAIIIVVSEETGVISVAENGNLRREVSCDDLKMLLEERLISEKAKKEAEKKQEEQAGAASAHDESAGSDKPAAKKSDNSGKEDS